MDEYIVNTVRSFSTGMPGRSLNKVDNHYFVIDEPAYNGGPGEEITPGDSFLVGVSACGVLLVERFAREAGYSLGSVEATVEGRRMGDAPARFEGVVLTFGMRGVTRQEAEGLVERYKGR